MSDIVLVGLIVALTGLIGAGISGIITFKVTKRQTDAQTDALTRTLQHQSEQARIERLIQARRGSIIPFGEVVARIYGRMEYLAAFLGDINAGTTDQQMLTEAEEIGRSMLKDIEELNTKRGQISDGILAGLVEEVEVAIVAINAAAVKDAGPQKWHTLSATLPELRPKLLGINRRIEELLSGDDLE